MARQILVPLDGSTLAEQALSCATMLAEGLPTGLVLLRAVALAPEFQEILDTADLQEKMALTPLAAEAEDYLTKVARRLRIMGFEVSTVVRCGPAADAIIDYAEQMGMSQIVMATHGYSGISRWVHGSVAERVLLSSQVPILLIRAREETSSSYKPTCCRRILVPLDGSGLAEQVLPPVTSVAKALNAGIILFRVPVVTASMTLMTEGQMALDRIVKAAQHDVQPYLDHLANGLRSQNVTVSTAVELGSVVDTIVRYAEDHEIDLIAMCTHGRTGLARWAFGSVTDRVLRAGRTPLFLVRARQVSANV